MMGERRVDQSALFYEFSLERHVPSDHMLRAIDRFVELDGLRAHLAPDPPPMKWSAVMLRKRRIKNGKQATEAGRDCLEVAAG